MSPKNEDSDVVGMSLHDYLKSKKAITGLFMQVPDVALEILGFSEVHIVLGCESFSILSDDKQFDAVMNNTIRWAEAQEYYMKVIQGKQEVPHNSHHHIKGTHDLVQERLRLQNGSLRRIAGIVLAEKEEKLIGMPSFKYVSRILLGESAVSIGGKKKPHRHHQQYAIRICVLPTMD